MKTTFYVRFEKHVSKFIMTYGAYNTLLDATNALQHLINTNTIDRCFIEVIRHA